MLIFDAHIDTLYRLLRSKQTLAEPIGHVNLPKIHQAKLGAQFFAAFVDPCYYNGLALHNTMEMIDLFWQMLEQYPDKLTFAGSGQDILSAQEKGYLACLLAIEGGEALEGKLANLRMFHRLGVRLLTFTWNYRNDLGSGQGEGESGGGLSRFGKEVVVEMNRLGMLIDVSHLNEPGFWDVLNYSQKPVLASHSNAKALCNHPRNLTDEQIRALAERGGVIGINFYAKFLKREGEATIHHVVEQIEYLAKVGGESCVALGSDFDGMDHTPVDLEDCSKIPQIASLLAQRGFGTTSIEKIMGGNLLRICQEVLD